jgi:hypothetical protein
MRMRFLVSVLTALLAVMTPEIAAQLHSPRSQTGCLARADAAPCVKAHLPLDYVQAMPAHRGHRFRSARAGIVADDLEQPMQADSTSGTVSLLCRGAHDSADPRASVHQTSGRRRHLLLVLIRI